MDKKDIYEHLANIYLDASSNKKKRKNTETPGVKHLVVAGLALFLVLSLFIVARFYNHKPFNSTQVALVLYPDILKINFHFDPAKKEICSINLNKLNMAQYKVLGFSAKKDNVKDDISLRIEFSNTFNEKAFMYIRNIPRDWTEYKIPFSEFKNITDWNEMSDLSFIIEEWNAGNKKDVVYLENVRIFR